MKMNEMKMNQEGLAEKIEAYSGLRYGILDLIPQHLKDAGLKHEARLLQ
jgi:hypothetical protein